MVFIFDMDGVIVDNHQWHFKAWVEFGLRHGIKITKEEFSRHFGSTNELIISELFGNHLSFEEIAALGAEKESVYRQLYKPFIEPVEGLKVFLQYLKDKGIPLALATSAPARNVEFTLNATGLNDFFSVITDSSMVSRGKPDPEVYLVTAAKLAVEPGECVVFEDSVAGIQSALDAGMHVIGVATTHKSEELLKYVKEIIMNFDAAEIMLEKWLTNSRRN